MASVRTFILAPNYHQKPDSSPIRLGSLIADPLKPTKPLSGPPSQLAIESVIQTSHSISRSLGNSTSTGISANLLSLIGTNVEASRGGETTHAFDINVLETRYLRDEPQDDDLELLARLQEPKVQAAIRSGLFTARPVYLISGLKIARGLKVRHEKTKTRGGTFGGTVPIIQGISAGGNISRENTTVTSNSFDMAEEDEVIFAYQVHKIKPKGRKASKATVNLYEAEAAFLHGEEEGSDNDNGLEVVPLTLELIRNKEEDDEISDEEESPSTETIQVDDDCYIRVLQ